MGQTMKRILVGLDGSPRAPAVLEAAKNIAAAQAGKLTLVRAVGLPPDVPQDFWKTTDEPLLEVLKRRARAYLDESAAQVAPPSLAGCEVLVGAPWQAVCDAAKRLDADVIIIGSHGYAGLDRLLGTTAAKIVNHASCTVVVVRERGGHEGHGSRSAE
jgi:nucleotide-binding universal stress UspA family protein